MTHYIYRTEHGLMVLPVSARGESRWERRERRRRVRRVLFEVARNTLFCLAASALAVAAACWYCDVVKF